VLAAQSVCDRCQIANLFNWEPENYDDEYRNRVMVLIEDKVKGRQITVPSRAPALARVIDLMAALRESMRTTQRGRKRTEEGKRKRV
jgi:DNA end-binding protein Ku